MTRAEKLKLNTGTALIKQATSIVAGLILPRLIIQTYGSQVNGLISSITQFLGFIALLEMGIGPVIQSNLYKPLAMKDEAEISKIYVSASRFFRTIGLIFVGYVLVLLFVYPRYINSDFDPIFTASLIVIISISIFAEYFFGITYQLLLNADQLAYIQLGLQTVLIILNTFFSVVLMLKGVSIQTVKLVSSAIYLLKPIILALFVHAHYHIDKSIRYTEEPIKQKWNGFTQHMAAVVNSKTDVVVLTTLDTLAHVSVYSVYYLVVNGVEQIVLNAAMGLEALWGNMIAKDETEELSRSFSMIETLVHYMVIMIFSIMAVTITPFIYVYTKGINDVNYMAPSFGIMLVYAYCVECLRIPYFRMIKAAGHYKQTQVASFVQALLNICVSVGLVLKMGLIGVAIGTFIAMAFHTIYFAIYLSKHIIFRPLRYFLLHVAVDLLSVGLVFFLAKFLPFRCENYAQWIMGAFKVSIVVFLSVSLVNTLFYHSLLRKYILIKFRKIK